MTRARTLKNVETLTDICIFDRLFLYDMLQYCLGIEAQSLYDQIDSKLIGSNIYFKKTWQRATINKNDCTFSVAYSLKR